MINFLGSPVLIGKNCYASYCFIQITIKCEDNFLLCSKNRIIVFKHNQPKKSKTKDVFALSKVTGGWQAESIL